MYKTAMACPTAAGDVDLNTKNRDKTIQKHNYGPLNLNDQGYWELVADKWNTTPEVAKKSKCGNCVAFDVSPRMDDCMPGPVSDGEGRLGYCWMHHFKCHSARTCNTWAKGGPIKKDEASHDWQKKAKGMEKEASAVMPLVVGGGLVGAGLGAVADKDNRLRGAAIGGGLGALGGYAGGKAVDHMVDTDPGVIRARAGAAKSEADLQQTIADGKTQSKKLEAELEEVKKKSARASEITKQLRAQLEQVNADQKAGKLSPMEASSRRVKIIQSMANTEKKAAAGEYDDSHMLSKILMRMSAQSAHLKEKIDAGLVLPSWAEYKLYNAYSSLGSALGTAYPGEYEKEAAATATKTDPAKWEAAKREAKAKMGGKHSARAMQLATQIYKKNGGGYSGSKPTSSTNSLKKWTKQDWGYSGKDKPGQGGSGVYLPKRRRDALKATKQGRSMLASATRKKHKATAQGKQYSSHGLAAGTSLKKTANSDALTARLLNILSSAGIETKSDKPMTKAEKQFFNKKFKGKKMTKSASSRVRSRDAYYQPQISTPEQPMPMPPSGNADVVNQQAQQSAFANREATQQSMLLPPPAPPSIQQNAPTVAPPFKPKYTGMM